MSRFVLIKALAIAIAGLGSTALTSNASSNKLPSQHCSELNKPRPGDMCYVVHENLGGKATARGGPKGGEFIIQPQAGNYVVDSTFSVETSKDGNGSISKRVLSTGASISSQEGYQSKIQEVERLTNKLEAKIMASAGPAVAEAKNTLSYLNEQKSEYSQSYQTSINAGKDAPKTQYTWSASSRKCGSFGLDTCGSWINFKVYEVRRYVGDPIVEYNTLLSSAVNQAKAALVKLEKQKNPTPPKPSPSPQDEQFFYFPQGKLTQSFMANGEVIVEADTDRAKGIVHRGNLSVTHAVEYDGWIYTVLSHGRIYKDGFYRNPPMLTGGGYAYKGTKKVQDIRGCADGLYTLFSDNNWYYSHNGSNLGGGGDTVIVKRPGC